MPPPPPPPPRAAMLCNPGQSVRPAPTGEATAPDRVLHERVSAPHFWSSIFKTLTGVGDPHGGGMCPLQDFVQLSLQL